MSVMRSVSELPGLGRLRHQGVLVETSSVGKNYAGLIDQAGRSIQEGAEPIEDLRGSAAYKKKHLARILDERLPKVCAGRRRAKWWFVGGAPSVEISIVAPHCCSIFCCLSDGAVFGAQEKLANVTIAYTSISPQYAPIWIAKEAGFFKRNGVNAQLVYMRGGVVATQALVSNDVNFINAGGGGVVDAVLGGADIFIVASPINQEPQVLVTRREIKDLAQLKGKNSQSTV